MENKKINVLFSITVLFFLALTIVLIKEFNVIRINDSREYAFTINSLVNAKNNKIRNLYNQLVIKQKENVDLKNTLMETRNSLEGLSKKLAQPAPVAAPVAVPAAAPAPATVTK